MDEATARYGIARGQLTIHQDRGSPMIAHGYLDLLRGLDVTCSHSRPRVNNDNAFSESQFKTQKYQPDYPGRLDHPAHARDWCEDYFAWYNFQHHHSGLARFTPEQALRADIVRLRATSNEHWMRVMPGILKQDVDCRKCGSTPFFANAASRQSRQPLLPTGG